jgi:hypothetical protein
MDPRKDPRVLIIALKGLPISIAALLREYPQPVTQAHLCDMWSSSDKTMSRALHLLEAFQILIHSAEGWSITANITQLGFSLPEWFQEAVEPDLPVEKPVEKGRKISDSSPLTTSSTSSNQLTNLKLEKNQLLELPVLEPEQEPRSKLRSENSQEFQKCHRAALDAGIEDPKATSLARLPHVSVELIEYHVAAALQEKQKIGLAIFRLERNWQVKKLPDPERSQDFYERQKYVTGKYADWINH